MYCRCIMPEATVTIAAGRVVKTGNNDVKTEWGGVALLRGEGTETAVNAAGDL